MTSFGNWAIVGYNHSFRIIMKYPRHCSASGMFVFNDVPSFNELWRKSIYGFRQRVDKSLNNVVNTVANTSLLSSHFFFFFLSITTFSQVPCMLHYAFHHTQSWHIDSSSSMAFISRRFMHMYILVRSC